METPLRVLLVAASRSRAASILDELRRAGYDVAWEIVRDRPEMEQAVSRNDWDVIIARSGLPGLESVSPLETASQADLGEAVLVLSDAIGDEDGTSSRASGDMERACTRWSRGTSPIANAPRSP
jgi:DNA-binding response OmpR family regulator